MKKSRRWKISLAAFAVAATMGVGIAAAQLSTTNRAVGEAAEDESTGEECASGLAVDVGAFGMICSRYCTADSECTDIPDGGCQQVYQPGSGERSVYARPAA